MRIDQRRWQCTAKHQPLSQPVQKRETSQQHRAPTTSVTSSPPNHNPSQLSKDYSTDQETSAARGPLMCRLCHQSFRDRSSLSAHLSETPYTCTVCSAGALPHNFFASQLRTHSEEKHINAKCAVNCSHILHLSPATCRCIPVIHQSNAHCVLKHTRPTFHIDRKSVV